MKKLESLLANVSIKIRIVREQRATANTEHNIYLRETQKRIDELEKIKFHIEDLMSEENEEDE